MIEATVHTDGLTRFLLPGAGVRGVHVRLHETWAQMLENNPLPPAVAQLLGSSAAAAALFTAHAKVDGRLSVQLRGPDALRTVFAECTGAGTVRGIVQLAEDADPARAEAIANDLRELGEGAVLALTIENPGLRADEPQRYQGLVAIESAGLAQAFEQYFDRSEQLPTRLLLAASDTDAVGLMLQKLPGDEGDADGWNRALSLFATLGQEELLATDADTLLHRLFHDEGVEVLARQPLHFACSCSRERVDAMLQSLGREEAEAALADGIVDVRCEFCGTHYKYDATQLHALFTPAVLESQPSERLH